MMHIRKDTFIGFSAGIVAGVAYGFNPLFAKPLLSSGVTVMTMLFFRYVIAFVLLAVWMWLRGEKLKFSLYQVPMLLVMGLLFSASSLTLFESYKYIPAGLATTIVYLYPVFTAIMMICMKKYPSPAVWISIAVTLVGVVLLCYPSGNVTFSFAGISLSVASALVYAMYLVLINANKKVENVSPHTITLFSLFSGSVVFLGVHLTENVPFLHGVGSLLSWGELVGLAIIPTIVSLLGLAVATRRIGPTKTSILGVFEPVTAIFIGTVIFGEAFSFGNAVGAFLCIAAILFMIISEHTTASEK